MSPSSLLKTKLCRPLLPADAVSRPRLVERLNRSHDAFLTSIVAPAGAGKSTLVAEWLAADPRPAGWLSLDDADNDLSLFLQYLLAAIQSALPNACTDLEAVVTAPTLPPPDVLTRWLINSLADLPTPIVLVLDDLHVIHDPAILDLLNRVIEQRPAPLRLVVTSRVDMPLGLSRLRARGQLAEIRLNDLRFTPAEIRAFCALALHIDLTDEAIGSLETRTEGWAAGVRLALLSLADLNDRDVIGERLLSTNRATLEYLVDEVLARQSPATQRFLLWASLLDRFTASLCDSVVERSDAEDYPGARAILDEIEHANLFLIPLDARGEWYRFHHLFREALLERLRATTDADDVCRAQRRASDWCACHGLLDEALQYALACGDPVRAAVLVEENITTLVNAEDRQRLERWLSWLPPDLLTQRLGLLMAQVWLNRFQGRYIRNVALLGRVEQLLSDEPWAVDRRAVDLVRGQVQAVRAEIAYLENGPAEALERGEEALARLPREELLARGVAETYVLGGLQALGRQDEVARRLILSNYREQLDAYTSRVAIADILSTMVAAAWDRCEEAARWLLEAAQRKGDFLIGLAWAHYGLGGVSLERNKLDAAHQHLSNVVARAYGASLQTVVSSLAALALIHEDQGQAERADAAVAEAERVANAANSADLLAQARSGHARLALLRGDIDTALRLVALLPYASASPMNMLWFEAPLITQARVWLAHGTAEALAAVDRSLGELMAWCHATHSVRRELELLVLSALAYEQAGRRENAIASLGQAVRLAEPRGSVRVFVQEGQRLVPLLGVVRARGVAPRFVERLLAEFPSMPPEPDRAPARPLRHAAYLIEPLTSREMEVLEAIAQRRTNKEIAARLVIAPATVQRHLSNIFQKLNAENRRDAADKARALGVLD